MNKVNEVSPAGEAGDLERLVMLPCPFCGEQPTWRHEKEHKSCMLKPANWIACNNKDCTVKPSTSYIRKLEDAVARWNTRAT